MRAYILIYSIFLNGFVLLSQNEQFQIEFETFSPDGAQMIQMMEDNPAEPFSGLATDGTQLSFEKMLGKPMFLWFWDVRDEMSIGQIDGLNLMHQIFNEEIQFVGFAYDQKPFVDDFLNSERIDFPILPNAFKLGELHYGAEMGQGRIFLIDGDGILKKAIPREFFIDNQNSFSQLRGLISKIINE